jgi:hypothetical protein
MAGFFILSTYVAEDTFSVVRYDVVRRVEVRVGVT